tara:strand:+ start:41 stop:226 length:186 start_codon:yes stop_codon:yes gene_type:complete
MTPQGENLSEADITAVVLAQNGKPVIGLADNGGQEQKSKVQNPPATVKKVNVWMKKTVKKK